MHVEIVEPTLVSEAGHCAALFASLQRAAPALPYRLWVDRKAQVPQIECQGVPLQRFFSRRWRKVQALWLYRRLLRTASPILVPTATWLDLRALDMASGWRIGPLRAFLYFHKWRASPRRAAALKRLAQRQPELRLYGTSEAIVASLREAGFAHVEQIVPMLGAEPAAASDGALPPPAFKALLSAGAARADKGFAQVVGLVQHMQASASSLPIVVQASPDHYGRYDDATRAELQRLQRSGYPHLTVLTETLDAQQYQRLFAGTICLQPYRREDYADKMSAVTFDALRSGAPIVTVSGTTMARIVAGSGAGVVLDGTGAPQLLRACQDIARQYERYSQAALRAAALSAGATWRPLVDGLQRAIGAGTTPP